MNNSDKTILDLCGGTGAWSNPYKEAGYDVRNITLPEYDVRFYEPQKNVYGILAAIPCTLLGNAAAHLWRNRESSTILEHCSIVTKVLLIIYKTNPVFWCIENPPGKMKTLLGSPVYKFQPFEFGHDYSKLTLLWGIFNLPIKITPHNKSYKTNVIENMTGDRATLRAITPAGFAKAFFKANP